MQRALGRYDLHEHQASATSWDTECVPELFNEEDTIRFRAHQCQYGLALTKIGATMRATKPTDFARNSLAIAEQLSRRCPGYHARIHSDEGRAKAAEQYSQSLVMPSVKVSESKTVETIPGW